MDALNYMQLEKKIVREIQKDPNSVFHHYLLSSLYLRQFYFQPIEGKFIVKARQLAEQAIELQSNSELGYLALASIYDATEHVAEAKKVLEKLKQRPQIVKSWRYNLLQARVFLSEATLDDSLALLEEAFNKRNALGEALIPHILLLLEAKHHDDKETLLSSVLRLQEKNPHTLFSHYVATAKLNDGDFLHAYNIFKQLLLTNPEDRVAKRNLALILYKHMNRIQEAKAIFASLLQNKAITKAEQSVLNVHLGMINFLQEEFIQAEKNFIIALQKHDNKEMLLEFIIAFHRQNKKYQELASLLTTLNSENPGQTHYYSLLGDLLADDVHDYHGAIEAYNNALVLDPAQGRLFAALGLAYYRLQKFNQALVMFNRARKYDATDARSFYNEACVYSLLERQNEALSSLQRAVELDAELKTYAKEDTDFDNIRVLPSFNSLLK